MQGLWAATARSIQHQLFIFAELTGHRGEAGLTGEEVPVSANSCRPIILSKRLTLFH